MYFYILISFLLAKSFVEIIVSMRLALLRLTADAAMVTCGCNTMVVGGNQVQSPRPAGRGRIMLNVQCNIMKIVATAVARSKRSRDIDKAINFFQYRIFYNRIFTDTIKSSEKPFHAA